MPAPDGQQCYGETALNREEQPERVPNRPLVGCVRDLCWNAPQSREDLAEARLKDLLASSPYAADPEEAGFGSTTPVRSHRAPISEATGDHGGSMITAFQPIHDLVTGKVIGAEALTRFGTDEVTSPAVWFAQAASVGLGADLEIAAVDAALSAATQLPGGLYVAVNVSPATCLDRRLTQALRKSSVLANRIVLELTEHSPVEDYGPLVKALAPLRRSGIRIAVDDTGAGYSSMRHIVQLAPEIIKLDKELITGIDSNYLQHALGAAIVEFAGRIGASVIAEGIESSTELAAVIDLGMTSGQGYFLGRPSVRPEQWARWRRLPGLGEFRSAGHRHLQLAQLISEG